MTAKHMWIDALCLLNMNIAEVLLAHLIDPFSHKLGAICSVYRSINPLT